MADYLPEVAEPTTDDTRRRNNSKIVEQLRAAATMIEMNPDLPEIISVGVNPDEITVQPWKPGAPVQAVREFELLMNGPIDRRAYPLVLDGAEQVSLITVTGAIDGHTVAVNAATHRGTPIDGFLGVAETTLVQLAEAETPVEDPADSDPEIFPKLAQLLAEPDIFVDAPATKMNAITEGDGVGSERTLDQGGTAEEAAGPGGAGVQADERGAGEGPRA